MSDPAKPTIEPLRPALAATARRVRTQRALDAAVMLAWVSVGLAGIIVALLKTGALPEADATLGLYVALALPVLAAIGGALRPLDPLLAARLLDRSHGLRERMANAVAFEALEERTSLMEAAMRDAVERAGDLSAARAMPLKIPVDLAPIVGLALGVGLLAYVEVPTTVEERILVGGIDPVRLHADDLDAYESGLRELLEAEETPDDVRDAAREFNRIIEDLADERLDRAESLRRIAELERRLEETRPADAEMMRDSLRELASDLRRAELANELSAALQEGDASEAERQLRRLAERLREDDPSRRELERLRQALERAAREREDLSEQLEQREEEMRRLLQRQQEQQEQPEAQRRLLQRRQRELERLRREHQERMERSRQLERLRRELSEAAEDLNRQQQDQAAQDMDEGAQDLNRMARQQMSQEEMEQMMRQLQELRELIRRQRQQQAQQGGQRGQGQQGQGGQGQNQMDRFVLRARGQGDGQGVSIGRPGQQGQQGQQQGQQGQGQGQGQDGESGQEGQQQMLTLGGDGEPNAILEMPGMGQGQQQSGQGQGQAQQAPGAGTGHDPTTLDDPTRLGGTRRTVRVEGEQSEGPSRSQTILSSAERGFANQAYQDVYTDYSGHAEDVLERDEIPPGRRFQIRRYFQLIRPRD